jgi:DNA-binding response OmpR family regulator
LSGALQASIVSAGMSSVFLRQASNLPLVIMGENTSQDLKIAGIRVGAVDFLEKPLSLLKLRNIWQHTVRKVCTLPSMGRVRRAPRLAV